MTGSERTPIPWQIELIDELPKDNLRQDQTRLRSQQADLFSGLRCSFDRGTGKSAFRTIRSAGRALCYLLLYKFEKWATSC
jgi:hypothetical protein